MTSPATTSQPKFWAAAIRNCRKYWAFTACLALFVAIVALNALAIVLSIPSMAVRLVVSPVQGLLDRLSAGR